MLWCVAQIPPSGETHSFFQLLGVLAADNSQLSLSPGVSLSQKELADSRLYLWILANDSKLMQTQKVVVSTELICQMWYFCFNRSAEPLGPWTLYVALDLANAIFSIPIQKREQKYPCEMNNKIHLQWCPKSC